MKTILYFSPTGNARFLALKLGEALSPERIHPGALEFTNPAELPESDEIIILFAVHAFNPPRTVTRFARQIPPGLCERISLIAVGCTDLWVNEAASAGLKRILVKKGYAIGVDEIIAMPLTFIMAFPEDLAARQVGDAKEKIQKIAKDIRDRKQTKRRVGLASHVLHGIGKIEGGAARMFGLELHAGKACTSCGICVKNCPEKNIRFNRKNKPVFGFSCLMCMRCIYRCPEKAISPRISQFIPVKGGYSADSWT